MEMAKGEILKGEVPGLVPGAAPLTGPAVHMLCQESSNETSLSGVHCDFMVHLM